MSILGGMTRWLPWAGMVLISVAWTEPVQASELKVEAVLIWGTNGPKPSDANLKPVDKATAERLKSFAVWKNYYEVRRKRAVIPSRSSGKIRMSDECEVEITELEGPWVEYQLIGRGKPVNKTKANFVKGDALVIGGADKDKTAWFVVLTLLE